MRIKLLILIVFSLLIVMAVGCSHNSETMKSTEITIEKTDQVNRSKGLISPFDFDSLQKKADLVVYGISRRVYPKSVL